MPHRETLMHMKDLQTSGELHQLMSIYQLSFDKWPLPPATPAHQQPDVRGFQHMIPFVTEVYISVRLLQDKIEIYKKNMSIKENIEKLEGPQEENDEDDKVLENMLDSAQDIQSLNSRIEFYGQQKNEIKVSSCIADVVQGTLLMMLLLRRDLRNRAYSASQLWPAIWAPILRLEVL